MQYLIRKITKSKWKNSDGSQPLTKLEHLSSDALTRCLFTQDSSLSFWEATITDTELDELIRLPKRTVDLNAVDNLPKDILKVLVALSTGEKVTRFTPTDIVFLKKEEPIFLEHNIHLRQKDGNTVFQNLKSLHLDLSNLNYENFPIVVEKIFNCINDGNMFRITASGIKSIVQNYFNENKEEQSSIPVEWLKELELDFQ